MTTCYAPGALRAYLDGELPAAEVATIEEHVATCPTCEGHIADLRDLDISIRGALRTPSEAETDSSADTDTDTDAAYARLRSRLGAGAIPSAGGSRAPVRMSHRRPVITSAAIAAALLVVLLVPPVRTAADSILSVFRGQKVVFVSVPQSRIQQLQNLKVDPNTLFLSQPAETGTAPTPRDVSTAAEAAPLLGFTPAAPTAFPSAPVSTTYTVEGQMSYSARVNVQTLRALLTSLGVTDVTIPDALGSRPISIILPPSVQAQYQGKDYSVRIIEGTSPIVNLPDGVHLEQLGQAVLEVYGMSPQDAAALSKRIDWRSTLVFPFPLGTSVLQQVNINGDQGVLLTAGTNTNFRTMIYWQHGSRFYIFDGRGALSRSQMVALAGSLR